MGVFFVLLFWVKTYGELKMKTIESLINASKKVCVRMSSDEICKAFFAQAEKEEFLFGGIKPTAKHPSDLIAVLSDKTLCYVNSISRMAAGLGAENVCVIDAEEIICT